VGESGGEQVGVVRVVGEDLQADGIGQGQTVASSHVGGFVAGEPSVRFGHRITLLFPAVSGRRSGSVSSPAWLAAPDPVSAGRRLGQLGATSTAPVARGRGGGEGFDPLSELFDGSNVRVGEALELLRNLCAMAGEVEVTPHDGPSAGAGVGGAT
jgi:hypothetical protein